MDSKEIIDGIINDIKACLNDPSIIYTVGQQVEAFEAMPVGVSDVDRMMSGGIPTGRITEIFGPESSGKTTLMLHVIAEAQKRGDLVYFVDAENSIDIPYAARIGVDPNRLLLSQPSYGEEALEVTRVICEKVAAYQAKTGNRQRAIVVVDSVPALVPKSEFTATEKDGIEGTSTMAGRAQMLSRGIPRILHPLSKSQIALVFINQERDKIGVTWGSSTTQPGGRALKFFSSVRYRVVRTGYIERQGMRVGIKSKIYPVKSKLFNPLGREVEVCIGNSGIDIAYSMVEVLLERKIVNKRGAWIKCGDRSWQGRDSLEKEIRESKKLVEYFEYRLKNENSIDS